MAAHDEPANGHWPEQSGRAEVERPCDEWPVGRVGEHRAKQQSRADHVADGQKSFSVDAFGEFGLVDQVAG